MANEFKVKNGLIVIGDLTTSGTITINGALAATQSWVTSQAYLTSASLSGYATQSYVTSAISSLIDAAPAALDTLNELAAALGDDANFSTTITNSIATKLPLAGGTLTGDLNLNYGYPRINFYDDNHNPDYSLINNDGGFSLYDITNNVHRIWVSSAGNVGIGTTSPSSKLSVHGQFRVNTTSADGDENRLFFNPGGASDPAQLYLYNEAQTNTIYVTANGSSYFNGGNVGIGTTAPNSQLDAFTTQGGSKISTTHGTGGSYPKASGISFGATSTSLTVNNNGGTMAFTGGAGIYANNDAASNNPTDLVFWTTSAGSPAARLTIASTGGATFSSTISSGGNINVGSQLTFTPNEARLIAGSSTFAINNNANNLNLLMVHNSTGNVGIGTPTDSGFKLDVNGTARVGALTGTSAAFSGNVGITVADTPQLLFTHSNTSRTFLMAVDGGNAFFRANSTNNILFQVAGGTTALTLSSTSAATFASSVTATLFGVPDGGKIQSNGGTQSYYSPNSGASEIGYQTTLNYRAFNGNSPVSAMFMASNGNVGIGTTSPAFKLEVNGGATGNTIARFTTGGAGGGTRGLTMYSDNSQVKLQVSDNAGSIGSWAFLNLNPDGGNVGVGTTSPESRFTVKGDNALVDVQSTADGQTIGFLARYLNSATLGGAFRYTTGDAQLYIDNFYGGNNGVYSDINIRNCDTGGNLINRIKIKGSSGNVGIGTTSPASKLHVWNGGIKTTGFPSAGNPFTFLESNYNDAAVTVRFLNINPSNGFDADLGIQLMNTGGSMVDVFTIKGSTGNVGIGTTAPTKKLHVVGAIRTESGEILANTNQGGIGWVTIEPTSAIEGQIALNVVNSSGSSFASIRGNGNAYFSGNVGIGNTAPGYRLQVNGDAAFFSAAGGLNSIITQGSEGKGRLYLYDGGNATIGLQTNGPSYFNAGNVLINTTTDSGFKLDVSGTGRFSGGASVPLSLVGTTFSGIEYTRGATLFGFIGTEDTTSGGMRYNSIAGNFEHKFYNNSNLSLTIASTGAATFSSSVTATTFIGQSVGIGITGTTPTVEYGIFHQNGVGLGIASGAGGSTQGIQIWSHNGTNFFESVRIAGANGNVGIGTTTPDSKLEVNGRVSIRGGNELYFGQSTSSIGSWTTRMYASGSTHKFNAQTFIFNNEGYGAYEHMALTANGINLRAKNTIDSTDSWLRLNQAGDYGSGVYTPGVMRADGGFYVSGNTVWHAGNDGSGSGLDADTVDGVQADSIVYGNARGTNESVTTDNNNIDKTGYYTSSAFVSKPSGVSDWMYIEHIKLYNANTQYQKQVGYDTYNDRMWVRTKNANTWSSWKQIWTEDVFANNSSNWNTAFGWGNHASAGYLTGTHNHDDRYYTETESDTRFLQGTTNPGTPGNFTLSIGNNGTYSYVQSHSSQPLRLNPLGNALEGPSGSTIWHSGNLTNLNQLSNGPGYITSSSLNAYLPLSGGILSGTLNFSQPVGLGFANGQYIKDNNSGGLVINSGAVVNINGTSIAVTGAATFNSSITATATIVTASEGREVQTYMPSSYTTDDLVSGHEYGWYSDHWRLGMTRSSGASGADFVIQWNGDRRLSLTNGGNLSLPGTITATGGNSTNWNTAYSWGNHASAGYATQTYVNTAVSNLVDAAPGTLDTLNELAAALGDDPNFATTVTNSIATKLPLAGGTMTGNLQVNAKVGTLDNQGIYLRGIADATHKIYYRTSDGGNVWEYNSPIKFEYYNSGIPLTRLTLDIAGNLTIGGFLTESSSIKLKENVETSEGNLEKVVNLRPVSYNKIGSQTAELGLIAEEVAEVYPEFVQYDENGEPIGVNYSRLTAALIGAVKELTNQVQELNKKING